MLFLSVSEHWRGLQSRQECRKYTHFELGRVGATLRVGGNDGQDKSTERVRSIGRQHRRDGAARVDCERAADATVSLRVERVPAIRVDELKLNVRQRVADLAIVFHDVAVAGEHCHDQIAFRWKVANP